MQPSCPQLAMSDRAGRPGSLGRGAGEPVTNRAHRLDASAAGVDADPGPDPEPSASALAEARRWCSQSTSVIAPSDSTRRLRSARCQTRMMGRLELLPIRTGDRCSVTPHRWTPYRCLTGGCARGAEFPTMPRIQTGSPRAPLLLRAPPNRTRPHTSVARPQTARSRGPHDSSSVFAVVSHPTLCAP